MDIQEDKTHFPTADLTWRRLIEKVTELWGAVSLKRAVVNVLVFTGSLLFTLVLVEASLRIAFHESMDFDMEMWKYATQIKTISENPEAGFEHQLNRQAHLMGVDVATNSYGLRDNEVALEKPENTYRIVVLGDSITLGWGVPQDQTYPAQLERLLNEQPPSILPQGLHYEVLNLGVGNYNTVQEVSRLRDVGLQFDPDLILLGYFINDAEPTPQPKTGFVIEKSFFYALVASRLRRLSLLKEEAPTYHDYYQSLYEEDQPGWLSAKSALARLVEIGREHNIPVIMIIIPEIHDLSDTYPFADIHEELALVGKNIGLPVIDLFPTFQDYTPEEALWVSSTDAHHNAQAQTMIAQGIMDNLALNNVDLFIFKEVSK